MGQRWGSGGVTKPGKSGGAGPMVGGSGVLFGLLWRLLGGVRLAGLFGQSAAPGGREALCRGWSLEFSVRRDLFGDLALPAVNVWGFALCARSF
jgi:hypothetical protein